MKNLLIFTMAAGWLLLGIPCAAAQVTAADSLRTEIVYDSLSRGISPDSLRGVITTHDLRTMIADGTLDIFLNINASRLEIDGDGRLKLEFTLEDDRHRLLLPPVIFSGNRRYWYDQRSAELSRTYSPEPYRVYRGVKSHENHSLDYKVSVPLLPWMEHARIVMNQYRHDCAGEWLAETRTLLDDPSPTPVHVEPEEWAPNSSLYSKLVSFLSPQVEEVKTRASMIELNIGFPVRVTDVRPDFGNNRRELQRADSLLSVLLDNDFVTVNGVYIHGYASPEGRYAANEQLAMNRSHGFAQYLASAYPDNHHIRHARTAWTAEDWEGLARLVQESRTPYKDEVLGVIRDRSMPPDIKDQVLQRIGRQEYLYRMMLTDMFPKLRRIALKVDYTVQRLEDNDARKLLYTAPQMLSQEEIYRVARYYEPGSGQYREVYRIAAAQYPEDVIANNNAAAAFLQEGDAENALPYLRKIEGRPESLINFGTYHYIKGDAERAAEYFTRALKAGIERAESNLKLIGTAQQR